MNFAADQWRRAAWLPGPVDLVGRPYARRGRSISALIPVRAFSEGLWLHRASVRQLGHTDPGRNGTTYRCYTQSG